MKTINLSFAERLIIANQFRILSALETASAKRYSEMEQIARDGITERYAELFEEAGPWDSLPEEQGAVLKEAARMYSHMRRSFSHAAAFEREGLRPEDLAFPGEPSSRVLGLLEAGRQLAGHAERKPSEKGRDTASDYSRMLERYRQLTGSDTDRHLSIAEIRSILAIPISDSKTH